MRRAVRGQPSVCASRRRSTQFRPHCCSRNAAPTVSSSSSSSSSSSTSEQVLPALQRTASSLCNLFPVFTLASAITAIFRPSSFASVSSSEFTGGLTLLMLFMGITLTVTDLKRVLNRPVPVSFQFALCFTACPALALLISKLFGLSQPMLAGMVLVGAINGGQASNLCTFIADGDVALSMMMTSATTIGCCIMTPMIAKLALGTIIPIDALGIACSTAEVMLAPMAIGIGVNSLAPDFCAKIQPFSALLGVITASILVGASVAQVSGEIIRSGLKLHAACIGLHCGGGVAGYWIARAAACDERTCRTSAIETSMKSSSFAFLIAERHIADPLVGVPAAVSVVYMALTGALAAVWWKNRPLKDNVDTHNVTEDSSKHYVLQHPEQNDDPYGKNGSGGSPLLYPNGSGNGDGHQSMPPHPEQQPVNTVSPSPA